MPRGRAEPIKPGDVFSRLTVLEAAGYAPGGDRLWACKCSCGTSHFVTRGRTLRTTETRSCGCLKREYQTNVPAANPGEIGCEIRLKHIVRDYGWDTVLETIRLMRERK